MNPLTGRSMSIPRGLEVLVKKASVDAEFKELLLSRPLDAAREIGLTLTREESAMLAAIPRSQLTAIIDRTQVAPAHRPAFLGKAAALMLAALGVVGVSCMPVAGGSRPPDPVPKQAPQKQDPKGSGASDKPDPPAASNPTPAADGK